LNAGVKFDDVAREFSEDKARQGQSLSHMLLKFVTGGSLGWKTRGALMPEFENVAFELQASTTNSPKWGEAKTSEGYHIIMVEGRK
jgi:NIMA-interacting peptidyl-prolyl cis-trans isomerase 4